MVKIVTRENAPSSLGCPFSLSHIHRQKIQQSMAQPHELRHISIQLCTKEQALVLMQLIDPVSIALKSMDLRFSPGFKDRLWPLLLVCPWTNYFTPVSLHFLIYKYMNAKTYIIGLFQGLNKII